MQEPRLGLNRSRTSAPRAPPHPQVIFMVILESSGVVPPEKATLENNSGSAEFLRALVNIPRPVFGFWPLTLVILGL